MDDRPHGRQARHSAEPEMSDDGGPGLRSVVYVDEGAGGGAGGVGAAPPQPRGPRRVGAAPPQPRGPRRAAQHRPPACRRRLPRVELSVDRARDRGREGARATARRGPDSGYTAAAASAPPLCPRRAGGRPAPLHSPSCHSIHGPATSLALSSRSRKRSSCRRPARRGSVARWGARPSSAPTTSTDFMRP